MNQIWPIGTEIWFRTDKKCGRTEWTDAAKNISLRLRRGLIKSLPASGEFWCLLITIANRLDPVQDPKNESPDLDSNCLTLWFEFLKEFFKKVNFEKKSADDIKLWKTRQICRTKGYFRETCKSQNINPTSPTPNFPLGIIQIITKACQLCFSA